MLIAGTPPWHLWGNTQTLVLPAVPLISPLLPLENTLVRASYGRPESWKFLLHAKILQGGTANTLAGQAASVDISFDLILGVGRSALTISDFAQMQFEWGNGGFLFEGWQTFVTSAPMVESITQAVPPAGFVPPRMDQFVAQDVTIVGKAIYYTDAVPLAPASVRLALSAQIAPQVHVRPDWYRDEPAAAKFLGAEIDGR